MRKIVDTEHPAAGSAERQVLVLGMGATGASCARHFAGRGTAAWFADTRATPPGLEAIRQAMPGAGLMAGSIPAAVPAGVSQIVVSPGVDLDLPVLADARRRGSARRERPRPVRRRVPRADDRHHRLQREEHRHLDGRRHAGKRWLARGGRRQPRHAGAGPARRLPSAPTCWSCRASSSNAARRCRSRRPSCSTWRRTTSTSTAAWRPTPPRRRASMRAAGPPS